MKSSFFERHFDVLLLEDSAEDRALYKRRLAAVPNISFDIEEAPDFQQAKDIIQCSDFDCYVIDYSLPDATGLDFIRYLLEKKKVEKAALILVTGKGNEELAAEAFRLGAHEYLTKKNVSDGIFGRPVINAIEKAQLTAQLQHFRERLENSYKDLSTFAHTAAHDLKSPLRRIISYGEILTEEVAHRLSEEDRGMLERMMLNAKRMQALVDSLLSYSLIEYEDEEKEEVDLKLLAEEVATEFEGQIADTGAKIEIGSLPRAFVYPIRVRQIFFNLVSNALKYKSDDPPRIVMDAKRENGFLVVSVQDNGEGIPDNQKQEIFKDFKRLHANEDIEGTGLGLSICKKIAERHGGKIWVESERGKGSTFYFSIKLN